MKKRISSKAVDRVISYETACDELGEQPVNEQAMKKNGFTEDEIIYRKLKTISRAINGKNWKPDMMNTNEKKWFPIFAVDQTSSLGLVFRYSGCDYSSACATDASRLCFRSKEDSDRAGKTFTELYAKFIK